MKKIIAIILIAVLAVTIYDLNEKESSADAFHSDIEAKSIYMVDFETGKVLYEKNGDESVAIASMTKMMTQYITLNAITNGRISWDDLYSPNEAVLSIASKPGLANLRLERGRHYTVRELFAAASVISANDAAVALAEIVAESEENFVRIMNEQANYFKLEQTYFFNSTGLDGPHVGKTSNETNKSSARDVAVIASKLIGKHPEILDFSGLASVNTKDGEKPNTNLMLEGMPYELAGLDGLKTGYTGEAGSCFASTGIFNGRRVITVVVGASDDNDDTTNPRFELTKELIYHYAR